MKAQVGDELVVKGRHVGDPDRTGVIIEVIGEAGGPPYLVRWSDGHESSFFPTSGTVADAERTAAAQAGSASAATQVLARPTQGPCLLPRPHEG